MEPWKQELYHHGILGMRWGKRNGPPYPLGASDHSASEKKAGWRKSLGGKRNEHLYDKNKQSPDNSQQKAKKIQLTDFQRKALYIGAGIAATSLITAGGVYWYQKYGKDYIDQVIKEGETLQTLSNFSDRMKEGNAFYAAFREKDKNEYIARWGMNGEDYKNRIVAKLKDEIKVASPKNAEKVFNSIMESNPQFREEVKKTLLGKGDDRGRFNGLWFVPWASEFERFATYGLLNNDPSNEFYDRVSKLQTTFYDALKSKGYGALVDVNDFKNSGFNTKAVIVFDKSPLFDMSVNKLDAGQIATAHDKFVTNEIMEAFVSVLAAPENIALGGLAIGGSISYSGLTNEENQNKKGQ